MREWSLIKVVPVYQLFLFGTFLSHLKLFRMTIQQDPYEPVKPLGTLGLGLINEFVRASLSISSVHVAS